MHISTVYLIHEHTLNGDKFLTLKLTNIDRSFLELIQPHRKHHDNAGAELRHNVNQRK